MDVKVGVGWHWVEDWESVWNSIVIEVSRKTGSDRSRMSIRSIAKRISSIKGKHNG